MTSFRAAREAVYDAQGRSDFSRAHLQGLSAWDRHKLYMRQYQRDSDESEAPAPTVVRTDLDVLAANHQFIRDEREVEASTASGGVPWPVRLARKYYDKLVKEYAICDLSRYRESRVGLRWRTEREVVVGKGQFVCAARGCSARLGLITFELPFSYSEGGEAKQALVKVRACEECAVKLNWKKERKMRKLEKALAKIEGKRVASEEPVSDVGDGKRRRHMHRDLEEDSEALPQHAARPAQEGTAAKQEPGLAPDESSSAHWKQTQATKEADLDDEMDEYLNDLFL